MMKKTNLLRYEAPETVALRLQYEGILAASIESDSSPVPDAKDGGDMDDDFWG